MNPDSQLLLDEMNRLFQEQKTQFETRLSETDRKLDERFDISTRAFEQRLADTDAAMAKRIDDIGISLDERLSALNDDFSKRLLSDPGIEARRRPPSMQQAQQRPLRIFCKEGQNFNIAINDGNLTLQPSDPTDETQHWFQHFDILNVKDDEGRRPFALVNRTTGQAMEYRDDKLQVATYSIKAGVNINMLWSLGRDLGDGFAEVRALKDISHTLHVMGGHYYKGAVIGMWRSKPAVRHGMWKFERILDQPSINTTAAV